EREPIRPFPEQALPRLRRVPLQQVLVPEAEARVSLYFPGQPQRALQEQQVRARAQQQESAREQRPLRVQALAWAQAWTRQGLALSQALQERLPQERRAR